ncbi:hypothetical protein [Desulfitibacter alkalitolerans]|uniref:hypothetical protein n=1 Tax=Desulfitibacter alkalitolerans TaxID=264641 RepID=UPI000480F191|nr:hypothetical protein [Desulfitibacter alkalitolerans]
MKNIFKTLQKNRKKLLDMDNVVGVGIGYKEKSGEPTAEESVVVFVKKKVRKGDLRSHQVIPDKIEETKTDVIEIGEMKLLVNTQRYRPVRPGCSIGHYAISAGTLGAIVRDKRTGERLLLSNNHVLANVTNGRDGRAREGDVILQPGAYDGGKRDKDVVAYLYRYAPISKIMSESDCPVAAAAVSTVNSVFKMVKPSYSMKLMKTSNQNNIVDAAVAKPARVDISDEILEIGIVRGVAEPKLGDKIKKNGRTTGYTEGSVKAVDVAMKVSLGEDSYAVFTEQVLSDIKSAPGDSGSLILDSNNRAIGLLFAGSDTATLFNKISNVMKELEVEF